MEVGKGSRAEHFRGKQFEMATVNLAGTVFGAVRAVISELILQATVPGDLTPVLMIDGLLALFGFAMDGLIQRSAHATA